MLVRTGDRNQSGSLGMTTSICVRLKMSLALSCPNTKHSRKGAGGKRGRFFQLWFQLVFYVIISASPTAWQLKVETMQHSEASTSHPSFGLTSDKSSQTPSGMVPHIWGRVPPGTLPPFSPLKLPPLNLQQTSSSDSLAEEGSG